MTRNKVKYGQVTVKTERPLGVQEASGLASIGDDKRSCAIGGSR